MKHIFIFALILLIQKNNLSHGQSDYEGLFDSETDSLAASTDGDILYEDPVTSPPTTAPPTPKRTTTLRPAVKISRTVERIQTNETWEQPEICELHQKCVPYYLCNEDNQINDDGSMLIDARSDAPGDFSMEQCPQMERCCLKETTNTKPKSDELCTDAFFNAPEKCGLHNPKGLGGQVSATENSTLYTQYAEFPWMMAVLVERPVGSSIVSFYQSGGSLIHPKIVITTAHSLVGIDPRKLVVRGGEWDTQTVKEMCEHVEQKVEQVISHEQFLRKNLQNDIALLVLKKEFNLTPFINTICLPPKGMNFDNQRCLTSGWGKNKFGKAGIHQVFLKKVELPIVSNEDCQNKLRNTRLGEDFKLHDGFLCAGGEEGKDLCTGDGGGPLVCEVPSSAGHFYQAGIIVGGIGCGEKDVPGFYLNVAKYRDWIDDKIFQLKFDTTSYTI